MLSRFTGVRLQPLHPVVNYYYFIRAHVFYKIFNYTIISFVGFSQGIPNLVISGAMTSRPSVKVSRRDSYSEFYGGRQRLEM